MGGQTRIPQGGMVAPPAMLVLVAALLAPAPLAVGAGAPSQKPQAPVSVQEPKPAELPPGYAGSEACMMCHEQARAAALPYHVQLETNQRLGWTGRGCEACHGPAKAHIDSGGNEPVFVFTKVSAARVNQACLKCHARGVRTGGRFLDAHSRNDVSCVSCHSVHSSKAAPVLANKPEVLCESCHTNVRAEFLRPHRHKLPEGAMTCVDCHNPHGTPQRAQLQRYAGNDPACLKCHGDKRGPFVFEHPPAHLEGCNTCHEPHGSVNPRMLNRAEVRVLCLECHTVTASTLGGIPPAFHDLRSPRFQNCTTCHVKIHGSYVNRAFLR